jgi:ABC-type lipoprotein export system ATPase subunit
MFTLPILSTPVAKNTTKVKNGAYVVNLRDVHKAYKTSAGEVPVLKGIDLQIGRGEFVSIIGKSGSGKSTLLNMITGIDRPTSGEIDVNGSSVNQLSEGLLSRWRGRNLGIVFQFFQLLPMLSVIENIMLPMDFCNSFPRDERESRALRLLELVELADHAYKLPTALSGGQQQRVAIARALVNDPPVIIADEPTGNLDSKTAESVFGLFNKLVAEGKTIIVVTHDSSLAKRATRTALIVDGEIANEYMTKGLPRLDTKQTALLISSIPSRTVEPGAILFTTSDAEEQYYVINSGMVEITLKREDAADVVVAQLEQGYCISPRQLRSCPGHIAVARASDRGPVQMFAIDRTHLKDFIDEDIDVKGSDSEKLVTGIGG